MRVVRSLVALALVLVPAFASAAPPKGAPAARPPRTARIQKHEKADKLEPKTCVKAPVEVVGAGESATFSLAKCDGSPAPLAVDQLSVLARPGNSPKPKVTVDALARAHGHEIAPGVRRLDPRLLQRLELAVDHFRKAGETPKVLLFSGYRPKSAGSFHQTGRALDVRIDGVTNEALVAFCKTLPDTGCGYYPNSLFVHIDVRDAGAGHVAWIDASRPGEPPKYVSAWPPPAEESAKLPGLPFDEQALSREDEKMRKLDRHPYFF